MLLRLFHPYSPTYRGTRVRKGGQHGFLRLTYRGSGRIVPDSGEFLLVVPVIPDFDDRWLLASTWGISGHSSPGSLPAKSVVGNKAI